MRLGEWDLNQKHDCQHGICANAAIDIPINEIITHEDYTANSIHHHDDIALILLKHSVKITKWIKPICLPMVKMDNFRTENFEHITMDVAGWGYTSNSPNGMLFLKFSNHYDFRRKKCLHFNSFFCFAATTSNLKMQVSLKGVSQTRCNEMYKSFAVSLKSSQMCAGGEEGFDSCRGKIGCVNE